MYFFLPGGSVVESSVILLCNPAQNRLSARISNDILCILENFKHISRKYFI